MSLQTPLCDLLGIRYPIIQSGMSRVAGPELVAEVSRAGGLGILAALRLKPDELRAQIGRVRELSDRPFGVNLWLHPGVVNPVDPATVPESTLASVQRTLDDFRQRLGIARSGACPERFPALVAESLEIILEERVPVWSIGLGNPEPGMVRRCHERGIRVMAMVTNVADARAVAASGVDIVVAQGAEAGGHRSRWDARRNSSAEVGTMVLVPETVDAVDRPVIAAGGIADGRGVVAALALGASGVMLGTRFIAAREAIAPAFFKDAVVAAGSGETVVSDAFTGLPMRTLRNRFASEYSAAGAPVLPAMLQSSAAEDIFKAAGERADREHFPMPAGQSVGLISNAPSAGDILRSLVEEAAAVLGSLAALR
jgi:nitronate monooxygenase